MLAMSLCTRKLEGKVAIVTGSSSGIGATIAITFAKEGANLSLTGRNREQLQKVAAECEKFGAKTVMTVGDISTVENREEIIRNTIQKFKKLDILVNNAGVFKATVPENWSLNDYELIMGVNVKAVYHLMSLAKPFLAQTHGNIVNISSIAGSVNGENAVVYCCSKAALNMLTKASAMDLGPYKIRVNSVSPGFIHTNLLRDEFANVPAETIEKTMKQVNDMHVMKRVGTTDEIANPVLFLASDDSSFMTGANILVDGGFCVNRPTSFGQGNGV